MEQQSRRELLARVGSMEQLAYVRPITLGDGRATGLNAYSVKNGPLQFQVMRDKCLDVSEFSYQGVNFNFLSKPGLQGRNQYDTHGEEALRSIMGGLFFTCGLENVCPPCVVEGKEYAMHGRLRTTPAQHVCADGMWDGDEYLIRISGEMREAELFGENMVLRRTIETVYGQRSITVRDVVENQSFREEPMCLLYHCNLGYPLLSPGAEILLPTRNVIPRDDLAMEDLAGWRHMDAPAPQTPERVFIHTLAADADGNTFGAVINDALGLGLVIRFNQRYLPNFMEWKSTASGDYVIGLEPSNASVYGRAHQAAREGLHTMAPFATETIELKFQIVEGAAELAALRLEAEALLSNH